MKISEELRLNVRLAPSLESAIHRWLAARDEYRKQANNESEYIYNETYFALGAAWAERHPNAANLPGGFESFRRSLISPETDE